MKAKVTFLSILLLIVATCSAWAQTGTIVRIETTANSISLALRWDGRGAIIANPTSKFATQIPLGSRIDNVPVANGVVELVATGDVKLISLDCSNNQITNLDITKCTELNTLHCNNNLLTVLDITKCTKLTGLYCSSNQLADLDITKCMLSYMGANDQSITLLEASTSGDRITIANPIKFNGSTVTGIFGATVRGNDISWLGLTGARGDAVCTFTTALPDNILQGSPFSGTITQPWVYGDLPTTIITMETTAATVDFYIYWADYGTITTADGTPVNKGDNENFHVVGGKVELFATGNVTVTRLNCENNLLTGLDITKCTALTNLDCGKNQLTVLDVTNCTALTELFCDNNQLTSLDMTKCTQLTVLGCQSNRLTNLDVTKCTRLTLLPCLDNRLTELDVTKCTALIALQCEDNQLTDLDVTNCMRLEYLECSRNQIAKLDITNCTQLWHLGCGNNQLTSLDVSKCTKLKDMYCVDNQITGLDVTKCTELESLSCTNNQLTNLDITNLTKLTKMHAGGQNTTLPETSTSGDRLTIENPLTYNGNIVSDISYATYENGYISWSGLVGARENAICTFKTELPNNITDGSAFSGTITQPWVRNDNVKYIINLEANDDAFGTVRGGGVFEKGESVTVTAMQKTGYRFIGWTENGNRVSTDARYTFTVNDNCTLIANFIATSIVFEELQYIREDRKGYTYLALEIPANVTITGRFKVKLPNGYSLDEILTKLEASLSNNFTLTITYEGNNIWIIEIKPNGLRSATDKVLTRIMDIAYTVDESVPDGSYDIEITDIELDLSNGESINESNFTILTTVNSQGTGIDQIQSSAPKIWSANGQVHIVLQETTAVQIVSIGGHTHYNTRLQAGTHNLSLNSGIYVVKAGSTTTKLIVKN